MTGSVDLHDQANSRSRSHHATSAQGRDELLEQLLGDPKLVPGKDLTEADLSTLAARHELAHDDAYEAHEPHN